ncbi:MAG: DUF2110 family protein [Candidatus Bathyarchaeia archaeon]
MKTSLLSGVYDWSRRLREEAASLLREVAEGLNVEITVIEFSPGLIHLEYEGEDERVYKGLLRKSLGEAYIEKGSIRRRDEARGVIVGHLKHGLLLDLGVRRPRMEYAILPRKTLNAQLADGGNFTMSKMVEKFCLIPFLALEVDVQGTSPRIAVELSNRQVEYYWGWDKMGFPRIVVSGPPRLELREALRDLNLEGKVVELESSTLTTHILALRLCEDGAEAAEILRSRLKTARISAYRPDMERFRFTDKVKHSYT